MTRRSAFTLIELLTVMAITAVLLSLILIPIVQSFNMTRTAQAFSDAQNRARLLVESISREMQNGAGLRDNEGAKGAVAIVMPGNDGTPVTQLLEYSKVDIFKPAQGDPSLRDPISGAYFNPVTGKFDPTLKAPVGDIRLPVAPGVTFTRYWIGLKYPLAQNGLDPRVYYNPHVDYKGQGGARWMGFGGEDNLYVLYRAEVQLYVPQGNSLVVNPRYFTDADGDNVADDIDDPYFFTMNAPGTTALAGAAQAAKAARMQAWKATAQIVTDRYRYDAIQPLINIRSRQLDVEGNVPRVVSLVQFRPTAITDEPAEGATALRLGEESDSAFDMASDVFRTKSKGWSAATVRVFAADYAPGIPAQNDYLVLRLDSKAGVNSGRLFNYDPDVDTDGDDRNGDGQNQELFDLNAYSQTNGLGRPYSLTAGVAASDGRSGFLANAALRNRFLPVFPDGEAGRILTSVSIERWGADPLEPTPRADRNLPSAQAGPALTPAQEPVTPGNFYDPVYDTLNQKFNKVWNDNPTLQGPGLTHRFMDLRVTPMADGATSPLHPLTGFDQAAIVPGSEIVVGPDQTPGPTFGQPVRYNRVSRGEPGANQYKLNYTDLVEPDYSLKYGVANPVGAYDPNDFTKAILQARYRRGYLQFNSDPTSALPTGSITVSYRVQFSRKGDTVSVDYDSRDSMSILLTIRNYPQNNLPNPQNVTLKGTATIRNVIR